MTRSGTAVFKGLDRALPGGGIERILDVAPRLDRSRSLLQSEASVHERNAVNVVQDMCRLTRRASSRRVIRPRVVLQKHLHKLPAGREIERRQDRRCAADDRNQHVGDRDLELLRLAVFGTRYGEQIMQLTKVFFDRVIDE